MPSQIPQSMQPEYQQWLKDNPFFPPQPAPSKVPAAMQPEYKQWLAENQQVFNPPPLVVAAPSAPQPTPQPSLFSQLQQALTKALGVNQPQKVAAAPTTIGIRA